MNVVQGRLHERHLNLSDT